jgi:hypothetical protein
LRFGDRGIVREFRLLGHERQSGGGNETAVDQTERVEGAAAAKGRVLRSLLGSVNQHRANEEAA